MKRIVLLSKLLALCVVCLLSGEPLFAQNNLVLVSGTDFSSSVTGTGTDPKVIWDINEVDGFLGLIVPTLSTSAGSLATTTKSTATRSDFLGKAQYAVTNNPYGLDELRMIDEDVWGLALSTLAPNRSLFSMSVAGLKDNSNFRIEIEYMVPLTNDAIAESHYNSMLRVAVNTDDQNYINNGKQGEDLDANNNLKTGEGHTGKITVTNADGGMGGNSAVGPIGGGTLKFSINTAKGGLGMGLMITSVKVYGVPDAKVSGPKTVCAGGESIILSVATPFAGDVKYQWYKKQGNSGVKLNGEDGLRMKHTSGNTPNTKTTYYYIATVPNGSGGTAEVKSDEFTVTDILCCMENGQPAPRKLVWQDDFGTFESATSYWTWDYSDIADPKKDNHSTGGTRWTYTDLGYDIPGALPNKESGDDAPRPEGWYRVVSYLSNGASGATATKGSNLGWTAKAGDGKEPGRTNPTSKMKDGVYYFPDHTYQDGSALGGMLQLNVGCDAGDVIYKRVIKKLCDKELTLKCFVNTFSDSNNPISIIVRATEVDDDGNDVGASKDSPVITKYSKNDQTYGASWAEVSVTFTLKQYRNVKIEVISTVGDGITGIYNSNGDDLLLDDIQIYSCSAPGADLYFNLDNYAQDTIECDERNVDLFADISDAMSFYYGNDHYQVFQYNLKDPSSRDFKKSWENLSDAATQDVSVNLGGKLTLADLLDQGHEKVYFRVIVGHQADVEKELNRTLDADKPYRFNEDDPCAEFSISKPIELTIKCTTCTPSEPKISADGGRKDENNKKAVHLCRSGQTTLSSNTFSLVNEAGDDVKYKYTWHNDKTSSVPVKTQLGGPKADDWDVSWQYVNDNAVDQDAEGNKYIKSILLVHDTYEDAEGTRRCDRSDTFIVYADRVPDVPDVKIPAFCEGLASENDDVKKYIKDLATSLTGYTETIEDVAGTPSNFSNFIDVLDALSANDSPVTFSFFLQDDKTLCYSDTVTFDVNINPIPVEPNARDKDYVLEEGKTQSLAEIADVTETGYKLEWQTTTSTQTTANPNSYTSTVPEIDLSAEAEYYYFIRQVSVAGCEGPAKKVKVTVNTSPLPNKIDTVVCLNDAVKLTDLVSTTDAIYDLNWYDTPNGTLLSDAPSVQTNVPGVFEFYVTQKSTVSPFPESKVQTVKVTVVGVYEPDTTGNTYHYCKGDQALPLIAKEKKDESKSFYANAMNWSVDGGTESTTVPTVDTDVTTTTSHEYTVYQSYKINNNAQEVCKGDPVKWKVEVTFVPALSTSQVTYMKADADEQGNFSQNLMERSGNAAIVNYTNSLKLWWYESDCVTKVGDGRTAPTPKVDPSVPAGMDDDSQSFCVKQEVDGCISEGTIVPILISDAPKPFITNYVYCRGDVSDKLTTKPDQSFKPNAQYVLKWYGNGDKGDMTDLGITGDDGPAPTTNMRGGDIGKSEYYYYVTQTEMVNGVEGAESNPTEIKVTIYDKTDISIDQSKLATVCKPQTIDIKPSVSFTNEVAGLSYDTRYYTDATLGEELGSTKVTETGDYHVQTRFEVTAMANSAVCVSDSVKIPVKIDTLQVLVENVGSCPDESTEFRVFANTNATDVKYTWNGITESDPNGGTSTNDVFTTRVFTGANYGDVFFYSLQVNAGTCEFKADTMKVTLGEGPVTGTMTVEEADNSYEPNTYTDTKANEFYSCGGAITITAGYHDKDGNAITQYEWFDGSQSVGTGAVLTLPEVAKSSDKTYRVEFTNGCKTSVTISIHYRPIKVTPLSTKLTKLCEDEEFTAEVKTDFADGEHPEYTWFRNGEKVELGNGTSLDVSRTKLTIDKVKTKDSGRYTFLMTNRGCEAKAVLDSLVAMPYIVATKKIDTIVERHSNPQIKLDVTVPAGGLDAEGNELKFDWNGNRGEHETTNPLTLNDVTSDHYYEVTLSGADLCDAISIVDIKVDAKLMLKTSLKDTICTGLSAVLVIDTTGTGKFRHEWPHPLTVTMETPGQQPVTLTPTQDGSLLKLTVSPTEPTVYKVRFSYGFEGDPLYQDTLASEPLYVIPAIGVKIPEAVTICEGEATDIVITDIQPEGTVIKWDADTTILTETLDTSAVTVKPVYMSGTNHEYMYGYNFLAYNPACNSSVPYTAYVNVDEPLEGEILGEKVICETFSSHLDASSYAATTYIWTLEGDTVNRGASMTVKPDKTAHYYLSMDRGACHKDDDFLLTVKTNPVIVDVDSVDIRVREVILKDGTGEEPFNFWVDDLSDSKTIDPVLYNLQFSKHTAHVVDKNGCVGQYLFEVLAPALTIPPYFTPNADGIHDGWLVPELPIVYPNAVVKIYDRFGKLLAEYLGSKEDGWDGTYNGHPMPSTDYWYVIDVEEIDRQFMGHFTLIRQ